ncbi:MAG: O-antigen ligase family protein [Ignavibacteriae bacterium]|nr:O-antigen ligase family protein [Ignavibacteriota bacterium]
MMQGFELNITSSAKSGNIFSRMFEFLKRKIIVEKLNSIPGVIALLLCSAVTSYIVAKMGFNTGVALIVMITGIPVFFAIIFNLRFGVAIIIIFSFFLMFLMRITEDIPLGTVIDLIIALMMFGLLIKQINERDWSFAKNPISKVMFVWLLYNILQVANPTAESRLAWVYVIRSVIGVMILYFIMMYSIKDVRFITFLIKLWIVLAFIGALWGYYQEYIGFLSFEDNWIRADDLRHRLLFIAGRFRKFSIFSDPVVFGYLMAYTSLMLIILVAEGPFSKAKKIIMSLLAVFMLNAMLFSGTRSAYVIIFGGVIFYSVLKLNKKILLTSGALLLVGAGLIFMPTSNPNLKRFQSAFKPSDDPSYLVRQQRQALIRPYIQSHPFGGGLGSVGIWGRKFNPGSFLAKFAPDSTYVRLAVETGWLGLLLYLMLLFTVFYSGVKDYFRMKDPLLKAYSSAMLVALYVIAIGSYPQQATQMPNGIFVYIAIAIINRSRYFDNNISAADKRMVKDKPILTERKNSDENKQLH